MLSLYRSLVRSILDYGCIVYGSARKSYLQMLDPIHYQGLRLCFGAFRTSPVESLYVDAHEPCLGARRAKLSQQYASKIKSLPKHPAHNAVFDNKYMKLFDARPNAIRTFGLRIKQFLIDATLTDSFALRRASIRGDSCTSPVVVVGRLASTGCQRPAAKCHFSRRVWPQTPRGSLGSLTPLGSYVYAQMLFLSSHLPGLLPIVCDGQHRPVRGWPLFGRKLPFASWGGVRCDGFKSLDFKSMRL